MTQNAHITFDLPTTRTDGTPPDHADGTPLAIEDILHTLVSVSADGGAHFSEPSNQVDPAVNEVDFSDLESGNWVVRFIVMPVYGDVGKAIDSPFTIKSSAPPNGVTNVHVELGE